MDASPPYDDALRTPRTAPRDRAGQVLAAGLILAIAAGVFLRLYRLGALPYGLWSDEAINGLDALSVLQGNLRLYFPANFGREPIYYYVAALTIALFGPTALGLRAASALLGILTLPATYLLGRSWGSRRLGLLSTAIVAVMLWHVQLSRVGFRVVALPLFTALALGVGALALQRRARGLTALAAMLYGLSFYTYLAVRLTPIALLGMLAYGNEVHRDWMAERRGLIRLAIGVWLLMLIPLAVLVVRDPETLLVRSIGTLFYNPYVNPGSPLATLLHNAARTLGMFTWAGDANWRHNVPTRPVFDPLMGALFVAGCGLAVARGRKRPALALSAIWVATLSLATLLSSDAPHFLRAAGMLPVLALLPAAALDEIIRRAEEDSARRWLAVAGTLAVIGISGALTARDLFGCRPAPAIRLSGYDFVGCYATDPGTGEAFQAPAMALAEAIQSGDWPQPVYLSGMYYPSLTYLLGDEAPQPLAEGETPPDDLPAYTLIVWVGGDQAVLHAVQESVPPGSRVTVEPGPLWVRLSVAAGDDSAVDPP